MNWLYSIKMHGYKYIFELGRGGVLGQGKGSGLWVKKRFMGKEVVNGNISDYWVWKRSMSQLLLIIHYIMSSWLYCADWAWAREFKERAAQQLSQKNCVGNMPK